MPKELEYAAINQYLGTPYLVGIVNPIITEEQVLFVWDNEHSPVSQDKFSMQIFPDRQGVDIRNELKGWKFQISINDTIDGNVERAWNLIQEELWKYGFPSCKLIKNDVHLDKSYAPWERGKQITIYTDLGFYPVDDERWKVLLSKITNVLADNHIRPSYIPCNCKKISPYISYRNDYGGIREQPISDLQSLSMVTNVDDSFNPLGQENPFANFSIDLPYIDNDRLDENDLLMIQVHLKKRSFSELEIVIKQEPSQQQEESCCRCCSCTML